MRQVRRRREQPARRAPMAVEKDAPEKDAVC
jgi:hypothetical protein